MRITLILLIFIGVLAGGVLPYVAGSIVAQQIEMIPERLAQQPDFTIDNFQHTRGWLSSSTHAQVHLPQALGATQVALHIQHGPLALYSLEAAALAQPDARLNQGLAGLFGAVGMPSAQVQVHPLGAINAEILLPRTEQTTFAVQGQFEFQPKNQQLEAKIWVDKLHLHNLPQPLQLLNTQIQWHSQPQDALTYALQTQWQMQQARLDLQQPTDLLVEQPQLDFNAKVTGTVVDMELTSLAPHVSVGEQLFSEAKLRIHAHNMDWQILQELVSILQKSPMQQRFLLPMFMLQQAKPFFSHQPVLQVETLTLKSPAGRLDAHVLAQLDASDSSALNSLTGLLQALSVQGAAHIDKALARQLLAIVLRETQSALSPAELEAMSTQLLQQYMQPLQERGWVQETAEAYRAQFDWYAGALHMNQAPAIP